MKDCTITVKEYEEGDPCFLVAEPKRPIPGMPEGMNLVFSMADGTDIKDAQAIAHQLNAMNVSLSIR